VTSEPGVFTDILLQNVKVLAVDQRFVRSTSAKPARAVTLEVDQVQAQKLVLAASVGKLSLTLKNNPASKTQQPRRISLDDLPNSSKPAGVAPQLVSEKDDGPKDPVVTIVRGAGKREIYRVPDERNASGNDRLVVADPEEQQAAPKAGPNVSRSRPVRASPPPLSRWQTRWSQDIANAANARKKKNVQEQPVFPVPQ
jgi:pilus assembly protein CpaB